MKARANRWPRRLAGLLLVAGLLGAPRSTEAQVGVNVIQGLSFGTVMPGVAFRVAPADAGHGEVLITIKGRVTVVLGLPAQLTRSGGGTIPLSYAATDGSYQLGTGANRTFDPNAPLTVNVPTNAGTLRIAFGGTISPGAQQLAGTYNGAVTVTVTPL